MKQLIAVAAATLALAGNAFALEKEPFSPERFAALQEAGEVVLVDVFADWCSTCKKLYSGDKQFWYSVAETRPEVIGAELDKAFKAAM
jgi:thioredoxin 1